VVVELGPKWLAHVVNPSVNEWRARHIRWVPSEGVETRKSAIAHRGGRSRLAYGFDCGVRRAGYFSL
jgi:hypothetical protein